jgi:glycosyltransferase involved in cell wall biosynthesis
MSAAPACSVVIPWHRGLADLRRAVDSVLAQSLADFEIVVAANGVSDESWAAATTLASDPRYRAIRLPSADVAAARNAGLDEARGELVFFLDADDRFHSDKLAAFVALQRRSSFDVAFSRGMRQRGGDVRWPFPADLWDGGEDLSEFFFCRGNTLSASAIVMSRRHRATLRFHSPPYEDPGLLLEARARGLLVVMLPEALYDWSDERAEGRLSRADNHDARLRWIEGPQIGVSARAKAAFRARCVGQHLFPRRAGECLGYFAQALRSRAVPPGELALFLLRGLIPGRLKDRALDAYFLLKTAGQSQQPGRGG